MTPARELKPTWGNRLSGLDGVRGAALLAVIAAHVAIVLAGPQGAGALLTLLTGLWVHGITCFFVLSGFLLYRPYASAILDQRPGPALSSFLVNRVLRIWPAYLVILWVVGLVFGLAVITPDGAGEGEGIGYLTDPWLLIANTLLIQGWWPDTAFTGLGVSWSLVTEIGFYVALPALAALGAWVAGRGSRLRGILAPALLLLVVGLCGRLGTLWVNQSDEIASGPTWSAVIFRSVIGQGDLFAFGMFAAALVIAIDRTTDPDRAGRTARRWTWALLGLSCVAVLAIGPNEFATPFMGIIFAAGFAILLLPAGGGLSRAATALLELAPMRALGEYSLSLYLWHFPVIWFMRLNVEASIYDSPAGAAVSFVMVLLPTLTLGFLTYRFVEVPALRRKRPTARRATTSTT